MDTTNMEELTMEEVKHIAQLANLPLNNEELGKFQKQLGETLEYLSHLQELATPNIPPTFQVTGKINELREDEVSPGLSQEAALKNSQKTYKGYFVAKVLWE